MNTAIHALSKRFESIYLSGEYTCPPKMTLPLTKDVETGEVKDYCNVMAASLRETGYFGSKTIAISQDGKSSSSVFNLYRHDGDKIVTLPSQDFLHKTMLRCAVLAYLVISKSLPTGRPLSVGIVGLGNLGQMIMSVLSSTIPDVQFILYARDQAEMNKASSLPSRLCIYHKTVSVVNYHTLCTLSDFVITATNASHGADLIKPEHLSPAMPTRFISFDSGFILSPEIRESFPIFFDSVKQGRIYLSQDIDEFPYDKGHFTNDYILYTMGNLLTKPVKGMTYSLYITGMALFDLILATDAEYDYDRYLRMFQSMVVK